MYLKIIRLFVFSTLLFSFGTFAFSYQTDFNYTGAKIIKKKNGVTIFKKSNGTRIFKHKDKEIAILKNGYSITKYSNGKRDILLKNKTKISIDPDRTTTIHYPNGKVTKHSFDGLTPYGTKIKSESTTIRRKNFSIQIIYSKKMSDDNMSKYMKAFYSELKSQVHRFVYSTRVKNERIKLVISNCRFGKTGYCKRQNKKELSLIVFKDNKKMSEMIIQSTKLLNYKNHIDICRKAINKLLINKKKVALNDK